MQDIPPAGVHARNRGHLKVQPYSQMLLTVSSGASLYWRLDSHVVSSRRPATSACGVSHMQGDELSRAWSLSVGVRTHDAYT